MSKAKIGRGVQITFFGHAAFKLTGAGVSVLIDPWLSNPSLQTPVDKIGKVDLILVTHGHGDHVGEAVAVAQASGAPVVAIHELSVILGRQGAPQVIGMNKGGTLAIAGCKVTMTQAVHSSAVDEGGHLIAAGDPGGFVVEFPNGFVAYHAGDTAVFKDMELIRDLYHPELAMLPIGSHYVMSPAEAALACWMLKPRWVIPMHYGTFPLLTGTAEEFIQLLKEQPEVTVIPLKPGEIVE
jgi:L-ascorbate metabolism protein UlaG (beta-lactamase superfamily)